MADAKTYDASDIQVLEGLDAVRVRPGMYIGSTGDEGLAHMLWEIVDNAVDEAAEGHGSRIEITLHADRSYEVTDNGRGIPVGGHSNGRSAIEVIFTELQAGGKFGSKTYSASGGLHGVGSSVVNALSTRVDVTVLRGGKQHSLSFNHGEARHYEADDSFKASHKLKAVKSPAPLRKKTGTTVRFWPDEDLLSTAKAGVPVDDVVDRMQQTCYLVPGLVVPITDHRSDGDGKAVTLGPYGGLAQYVNDAGGNGGGA